MSTTKVEIKKGYGLRAQLGFVLIRFVIPIWVLTGAVFKLEAASPKLLPKEIFTAAVSYEVNVEMLLAVVITLEFFAAAVMFFLPKFARLMAIWMTGLFVAVLINEIAHGNATDCGCLGEASPSPWVMLAVDSLMLLGALFLANRRSTGGLLPASRLGMVAGWTVLGGVLSGIIILRGGEETPDPVIDSGNGSNGSEVVDPPSGNGGNANGENNAGGGGETPAPVGFQWPARGGQYMVVKSDEQKLAMVGKPWTELTVLGWLPKPPSARLMETGRHYVVLYSKSCEHCQELAQTYFTTDPPKAHTIAIAMPENKDSWGNEDLGTFFVGADMQDLPLGTWYLDTPPVVIAIEDGVITCVEDGVDVNNPLCLPWHK